MKFIITFIMAFGLFLNSHAQNDDLLVYNFWSYYGDVSNSLYKHICNMAFDQINHRRSVVKQLTTENDWRQYQAEIKGKLQDVMGVFPPKTPLNPVITEKIRKDGFSMEKLYFESRPNYYVTAILFLPDGIKQKRPAILYCNGHSGFRRDTYQRIIMNYVKKGFIVLAFDPVGQGERVQYFDEENKPLFTSSTREHSYPGTQIFLCGVSPANYFVWDGIRCIDYLISRKEVDPERIGVTGLSGGGTLTAFLCAVDDRVVAAAPECYITSYDMLLRSAGPQDAEQNLIYSIYKGIDMSDLIVARAPKPTLMSVTTRDFFSIQGAYEAYGEAKTMFTAMQKPDDMRITEDDYGHGSTAINRVATHAFFQEYLNHPGDPKDEEIEFFDEKDLWVTPTGQVQTSLKGETLFSLNEKYTAELLERMQSEKRNNPDFYTRMAHRAKSLTGYCEPALPKDVIFSGRQWRDDCAIEKYLVKGPGDYYIPVLRLSSGKRTGQTVLLLDDQGKASAAAKGGLAEKLVQKGYQVIAPDLNGFGELGGGYKGGDARIMEVPLNVWYAGVMTHKSPLAVRVEEIKIMVDFIKELGTFGTLTGIACGTLTADLLHAAVINREFNQIALINPLISYQSIVQEKNYHPKFVMSAPAGVIGQYDLPDLVAAIAPFKICMLNPVNALDQMVDNNTFDQVYSDARKKYGDSKNMVVGCKENDVFLKLYQWLDLLD